MKSSSKYKKALVTGGAGFIGSHLCEELLSQGYQVTVVDNLSTGRLSNITSLLKDKKHFKFYKGSILDERLMDKLIKKSDIIFHLAAAVGVKLILEKTVESINTNIHGTGIILKLASKYQKKVILASSSEVYGKPPLCVPLKEESDRLVGPTSVSRWSYSVAKACNEFEALAYAREKKLPVVIVRLFNTVGPRQVGHYGMVLPRFIEQALLNKPITVHGNGQQIRSFSYVKDVVKAIIKLSQLKKAENHVFNIGSHEYITIKELAHLVKKKANSKSKIVYIAHKDIYGEDFEDVYCRIGDISKLKQFIGYKPKHSLNDIIDETIKYFKQKLKRNK